MALKGTLRKRTNAESLIQAAFFKWLDIAQREYRPYCFAIPNGGSRHVLEALRFRDQGVTPGIPDVLCALARQGFHGLFIEFKRPKVKELKKTAGKLSEKQKEKIELLMAEGYLCKVAYSVEEAMQVFCEYVKKNKKSA